MMFYSIEPETMNMTTKFKDEVLEKLGLLYEVYKEFDINVDY